MFAKFNISALPCMVVCALSPLVATAQFTPNPADGTDVLVTTVDTEPISGRLVSFSIDRGLILEDFSSGQTDRIPARNVVRLSTNVKTEDDRASAAFVTLVNDDRIVGRPVAFEDDIVTIEGSAIGRVGVSLESVTAFVTSIGAETSREDAVNAFLAESPDGDDRVLLANGDVVTGIVLEVNAENVAIETLVGIATLPFGRVAVVQIASTPPTTNRKLAARVYLRDGSRFRVRSANWTRGVLRVRLSDDQTADINAEHIVRVDIEGGRWQSLSDLTPLSAGQTPMMSIHWPVRRDRNVLDAPLHVAGKRYERGLGVHSRSSLTYDLRGDYGWFTTFYGIDDDSGPLADVHVSIRVDGQNRHERRDVKQGVLFGPVRLDVSDASRIELVVDFGKHGGVQDRFNWIDPALIRNPK